MTSVGAAVAPARTSNGWALGAVVFIATALGAWWSMAPYVVGVFHDDGIYAILARSIAEGTGFHYLHLPGVPAASHYPPLYPLLLAGIWKVAPRFPANLPWMLAANALLAGVAACGWWIFATRRLGFGARVAVAGAIVVMLTAPMLTLAGALLSEILFVALLWPALVMCERALDDGEPRASLAAGVLIGALVLVRVHAVALLIGYALLLVVRRSPRSAWLAPLTAIAVQVPWLLWSEFAVPAVASPLEGSYGSYLRWYLAGIGDGGVRFPLDIARVNARELWLLLNDRFALGISSSAQLVVGATVLAALAVGAVSSAKRAPLSVAFAIVYLAIVLVWPWAPWRFAFALWPLIALLILEGARRSWGRWPRMRPILAVGAVLPAFAFVRTELHAHATRGWRIPARDAASGIAPLLQWVRTTTRPSDVIFAEGEQVVFLYTGRQAAPPIAFTAMEYLRPASTLEQARSLAWMLQAVPATWLVTGSQEVTRAAVALRDSAHSLREVDAAPGLTAFEVLR